MTEQYTNYANVRVEDIPPHGTFQFHPSWRFAWRSPVKYLSLNGRKEFHYIHEWLMPMPSGECLIREEYFGDKIISTSYRYECGGITQVYYSDRAAYFVEDGAVRKEELKDNVAKSVQQLPVDEKSDEHTHLSTEGKLQLVKEKLKEFMSILDSTFVMDNKSPEADNGGTSLQWFGAEPDPAELPLDLPLYSEHYLHADSVTGHEVNLNEDNFLIMRVSGRRMRVGKDTEIVHLLDYEKIEQYGRPVVVDGWTISDGKVAIYGTNDERTVLPNGTKFKVVDYSDVINWGEIVPGTLAIRYPDYKYPTL